MSNCHNFFFNLFFKVFIIQLVLIFFESRIYAFSSLYCPYILLKNIIFWTNQRKVLQNKCNLYILFFKNLVKNRVYYFSLKLKYLYFLSSFMISKFLFWFYPILIIASLILRSIFFIDTAETIEGRW